MLRRMINPLTWNKLERCSQKHKSHQSKCIWPFLRPRNHAGIICLGDIKVRPDLWIWDQINDISRWSTKEREGKEGPEGPLLFYMKYHRPIWCHWGSQIAECNHCTIFVVFLCLQTLRTRICTKSCKKTLVHMFWNAQNKLKNVQTCFSIFPHINRITSTPSSGNHLDRQASFYVRPTV